MMPFLFCRELEPLAHKLALKADLYGGQGNGPEDKASAKMTWCCIRGLSSRNDLVLHTRIGQ
jgi:hypothetical protein